MVYGIGETVLDIVFKNDQPLKAVPGGSTFNAIVSLGRYGVPCAMVTQVGDDHVGDITRKYLQDNGVNSRHVYTCAGMKSHISLAYLDEQNDAQYTFYKDHNAWTIEEDALRIPIGADDVLLLGSYYAINPVTRPLVSTLLHRAKEAGAYIYYDINFRRPHVADLPRVIDAMRENIALATTVRGSQDDIDLIGFMPECSHLIITNGSRDIRIYRDGQPVREYAVLPTETVSTIGAGDNFNAGYIAGYLQGLDEDSRVTLAQRFAQNVCRQLQNSIELPL